MSDCPAVVYSNSNSPASCRGNSIGERRYKMNFENGMTCEIMISNGPYTVGYVNGKPAEWVGNNEPLGY